MPRPGPERLRRFALDALEEAIADAEEGPVRRSWALRLALAYLASLNPRIWSPGEPYRDFWRALSLEGTGQRRHALERALTTIYAWADAERDGEWSAIVRDRARGHALEQHRNIRSR